MKIAYFTDTLTPQINGVTYVVETHSKLLSKNNDVVVFAPAYGLTGVTEDFGRLVIKRYPSVAIPKYKDMNISFINIPNMIKEVKEFNPDIIHFHSPATMGIVSIIIARYLKVPLFTTYHTLWSETLPPIPPFAVIDKFFSDMTTNKNALRKTIWSVSKKIFDYCDVIISPADIIKKELIANNHRGKIKIISNGIDTKKFKGKIRSKTNFKMLYVGRLSHEKQVDIVIKSFNEVQNKFQKSELLIVGDGNVKKNLKNLAKELKLSKKIKFTGSIDREKIVDYYKKCDIFVTASEMEVQPLTLLEAMSCSLPIVGVNKAGVAGIVKNNINGYLVSSANHKLIADRVIKIFENNDLRIKMAKESRKIAEENSMDESIKKLEKLYNQIAVK
jgi:glycosyltransferase involved in cell wall biosynthesis